MLTCTAFAYKTKTLSGTLVFISMIILIIRLMIRFLDLEQTRDEFVSEQEFGNLVLVHTFITYVSMFIAFKSLDMNMVRSLLMLLAIIFTYLCTRAVNYGTEDLTDVREYLRSLLYTIALLTFVFYTQ